MPSLYTFARNMSLVSDARAMSARARHIDWRDSTPMVAKVHGLDELRDQIDMLEGWKEKGAPIGLGWGMYSGDSLLLGLRHVYVESLTKALVVPTKAELEHELAPAAGQTRSSIEQYGAYFTRLKSYLSMTDPAHLQAEDGDREAALLTDAWARAVGLTSTIDKSVLKPHVDAYVHMVAKGEAPPWTPDQALVARVRAVLAQTSRLDRDYSALVREANDNVVPISRSTVFRGSSLAEFVTSKAAPEVVVAGAFTRTGWESYVRDGLDDRRAHKLAHDRWVFGETEEKGVEEIKAELKQPRDALLQRLPGRVDGLRARTCGVRRPRELDDVRR